MSGRASPFARLRPPREVTIPPREAARAALEQLRDEQEREAAIAQERAEVQGRLRRPLLEWARDVPTARHGPLRFGDFPFQRELYGAEVTHDREVVVQKCTQGGFSEWALRLGLFHADRGRTVMYVFPEQGGMKDFSSMRIRPVLRGSDYLQSRIQDEAVDNVTLKQIGLGWVAFRGSNAETGLMSVDADLLILDEYDRLEQDNIGEAEQRVTGPLSAGMIRRLGVPTLPGWGISKLYEQSDQRVWTVRCEECDEWNPMHGASGWLRNVDKARAIVVCRRCREPLDVRRGEWVAKHPGRAVRGYHLPKYAIYGVDIKAIVERSLRKRPLDVEKFHRNDLGIGFTPADARLSREAILACVRRDLMPLEGLSSPRLVTMGVDAKSRGTLHVTISEHLDEYRKRKVAIFTVEGFAELVPVMDRYGVNMAAIDYMPEWQQAMAFVNRFPGRAYRAGFLTGKEARQATKVDVPIQVNEEEHLALVRRTQILDTTLTNFRQQFVLLPDLDSLPAEYPDHLMSVARVTEDEESGKKKVFYRSIGDDDFALAEAYDVVATDLWYRQRGLEAVQLAQTQGTPTADAINFVAGDTAEDVYRPGLGDEDGFAPTLE